MSKIAVHAQNSKPKWKIILFEPPEQPNATTIEGAAASRWQKMVHRQEFFVSFNAPRATAFRATIRFKYLVFKPIVAFPVQSVRSFTVFRFSALNTRIIAQFIATVLTRLSALRRNLSATAQPFGTILLSEFKLG